MAWGSSSWGVGGDGFLSGREQFEQGWERDGEDLGKHQACTRALGTFRKEMEDENGQAAWEQGQVTEGLQFGVT